MLLHCTQAGRCMCSPQLFQGTTLTELQCGMVLRLPPFLKITEKQGCLNCPIYSKSMCNAVRKYIIILPAMFFQQIHF